MEVAKVRLLIIIGVEVKLDPRFSDGFWVWLINTGPDHFIREFIEQIRGDRLRVFAYGIDFSLHIFSLLLHKDCFFSFKIFASRLSRSLILRNVRSCQTLFFFVDQEFRIGKIEWLRQKISLFN